MLTMFRDAVNIVSNMFYGGGFLCGVGVGVGLWLVVGGAVKFAQGFGDGLCTVCAWVAESKKKEEILVKNS
jgi:hypothetical protein